MKKYILISFVCFVFAGCISFSQIEKNKKLIDATNGINDTEALLVAQNVILASDNKAYDGIIPGKIRKDEAALKYPDYWFIDYSPTATMNYPSLLIVINKADGTILLTKNYWPNVVKDLDWVFKK